MSFTIKPSGTKAIARGHFMFCLPDGRKIPILAGHEFDTVDETDPSCPEAPNFHIWVIYPDSKGVLELQPVHIRFLCPPVIDWDDVSLKSPQTQLCNCPDLNFAWNGPGCQCGGS